MHAPFTRSLASYARLILAAALLSGGIVTVPEKWDIA